MTGISLGSNMVDCKQVYKQLNSTAVKKTAMDPQKVKEILDFKERNIFPPNFTKSQRYILKRRAESYHLLGKINYTIALHPMLY